MIAPPPVIEPPRAAIAYRHELTREARYVHGLLAPVPALAGQITQESSWNPDAKSKFADGLAQFTPKTAEWISGVYKELGPSAPLNPQWAMRAMIRYDKRLHDGVKVADTECDRWKFALSDYNGGSGRREARQRLSPSPGSYDVTGTINPGIAPSNQAENENYAPRVLYRWQPVFYGWGGGRVCAEAAR